MARAALEQDIAASTRDLARKEAALEPNVAALKEMIAQSQEVLMALFSMEQSMGPQAAAEPNPVSDRFRDTMKQFNREMFQKDAEVQAERKSIAALKEDIEKKKNELAKLE